MADQMNQMDSPQEESMETPAAEAPASYYIEICVHPDGTFTVTREEKEEEAAEPNEKGEAPEQTYRSIGEALKQALAIFRESGASDEQSGFDTVKPMMRGNGNV